MNPLSFVVPFDQAAALTQIQAQGARFIAGGTNLVDLMKERVMLPQRLVDINRLALDAIEADDDGGLRLGALAWPSWVSAGSCITSASAATICG